MMTDLEISNIITRASDEIDANRPFLGVYQTPRRQIANIIDAFCSDPRATLLGEDSGRLVTSFHTYRMNRALERLSTTPKTATLRLTKGYSSSWLVELGSYKIAIDFADGPFILPHHVPLDVPFFNRLAAWVDTQVITHTHGDHYSSAFAYSMLSQPRMSIVPQSIVDNYPSMYWIPCETGSLPYNVWGYMTWQWSNPLIPSMLDPFSRPNMITCIEADGIRIIHMGDANDSTDVDSFIAVAQKRGPFSRTILLNGGLYGSLVAAQLNVTDRFRSHELEFSHPPQNGYYGLQMPTQWSPMNQVLFWGESIEIDA